MNVDIKACKAKYGKVFDEVSETLFEIDPIGISFTCNTDEYEPEVATILPRLETATNVMDVQNIIYEELDRWFSGAYNQWYKCIGDYEPIANRVWKIWISHQEAESE